MVMDSTDLLALPAVGLALSWMRRAPRAVPGRSLERVALVAAAVASMATSPVPRLCAPSPDGASIPWERMCTVPGAVDLVLAGGQRATVTLPLTAKSVDCKDTLGVRLSYDVPGARADVEARPMDAPVVFENGRASLELTADLPFPTTCAALVAYATTTLPRPDELTPPPDAGLARPSSRPPYGRLELSIASCREVAEARPLEVAP
jgi:hypothetical protein